VARPELVCIGCQRRPREIGEYVEAARAAGMSPAGYVWAEEGTLNSENGHFLCTSCYVLAGMPVRPGGWRAP
jgi:hypothetical protein